MDIYSVYIHYVIFHMRDLILYIVKTFFTSFGVIVVATFLAIAIYQYFIPPTDITPYSSPVFVALVYGVVYSIGNIPVIPFLYKFKFSKIELAVESICFIFMPRLIDNLIQFFFSNSKLWIHDFVRGQEIEDKVWWYDDRLVTLYGICFMVILCFIYTKIKQRIKHNKKDV